jgi:hypothetical protein
MAVGDPTRGLLPVLVLLVLAHCTFTANAALNRIVPRTPDQAARQQVGRVREAIRQRKLLKPKQPPAIPGDQLPNLVSGSRSGRAAADPRATVVAGTWIVRLAVPSAAAALAPPTGSRAAVAAVVADPSTDRRGRNVTAARAHVQAVEASIASVASVAGIDSKITHRYAYAMSGFAVKGLTLAELQALRSDPRVLSVTPNRQVHGATYTSPWFLGLTGPNGQAPGGPVQHNPNAAPKGVWDKVGSLVGYTGGQCALSDWRYTCRQQAASLQRRQTRLLRQTRCGRRTHLLTCLFCTAHTRLLCLDADSITPLLCLCCAAYCVPPGPLPLISVSCTAGRCGGPRRGRRRCHHWCDGQWVSGSVVTAVAFQLVGG